MLSRICRRLGHTPSVYGLFLVVMACNNPSETTKSTENCRFGQPTAIFNDSMPTVKKHVFTIKDGTGIEYVAFENKLLVEIEQSGCNELHQQFTFVLMGDFKAADDATWIDLSVKFFEDFAHISPQLMPFKAWADEISRAKDKLRLSEALEIQPKIHVRLDKIVGNDRGTLVVQLWQAGQ